MKKVIVICIVCVLCLGLGCVTAGAAGDVTIQRVGSNVVIRGNAGAASKNVSVTAFEENGALVYMYQKTADSSGAYTFVITPVRQETHTLSIFVKIEGGEKQSQSFLYEVIDENVPQPTPTKKPGTTGGGGTGGSGIIGGRGDVVVATAAPAPSDMPNVKGFQDMDGHWATAEVNALSERGIVSGLSETEFAPEQNVTRAEFVKLAVCAIKVPIQPYTGMFTDVSGDAWYAAYVQTAAELKIISGDGERFRPDESITREEIAKILVLAFELKQTETTVAFADAESISEWAVPFVCTAAECKIIQGYADHSFMPQRYATRAEAAVMIYRVLNGDNI